MVNFINEIAKPVKSDRFNTILKVLQKNNVQYEIQQIPFCRDALGNIVVSFNKKDEPKLVFSAHYDNFDDTPGANDNAAACSILLNMILEMKENTTKKYVEFVFFDMEERGFLGSRQYSKRTTPISTIFNLDMCGMGSNICVCHDYLTEDMKSKFINCFPELNIVKLLPAGDAYTFMNEKIPTVYVINSTDNDLPWFKSFYHFDGYSTENLDFIKTMHKRTDTPDTVNLDQAEKIEQYLSKCLSNW